MFAKEDKKRTFQFLEKLSLHCNLNLLYLRKKNMTEDDPT